MDQHTKLTARFDGPIRLTGKALLAVCSYRGGSQQREPWHVNRQMIGGVVNRLTLLGLRQFIAAYRDHFANPRDFAYQMGLVQALLEHAHFNSVDMLVDAALVASADEIAAAGAERVTVSPIEPAIFATRRYDTIVLIYPDALGLSWSRIEACALAAADTVAVVNGRRRLFILDRSMRRALLWRRFLANTRIAEFLVGMAVIPLAAILAMSDRLRQRI